MLVSMFIKSENRLNFLPNTARTPNGIGMRQSFSDVKFGLLPYYSPTVGWPSLHSSTVQAKSRLIRAGAQRGKPS